MLNDFLIETDEEHTKLLLVWSDSNKDFPSDTDLAAIWKTVQPKTDLGVGRRSVNSMVVLLPKGVSYQDRMTFVNRVEQKATEMEEV